MLHILDSVLSWEKLQTHQIVLKLHPFMPQALSKSLVKRYTRYGGSKNIQVVYRIGKDVPKTLVGDSFRLNEVIGNFLSNACKVCK